MSDLRVHLLGSYEEADVSYLRSLVDENVMLSAGKELAPNAVLDVLVSGRPTRAQLERQPQLKMVVIPWAGLPSATRELMLSFPEIAVHNLHHNAAPTAELAVALLMAAAKFVVPYDRKLRANDWTMRYERPGPSVLLAGKTALVLGYGAIGRRVGRACRALEMEVLGVKRTAAQAVDDVATELHPPQMLQALLPRADALIICLPLTPETEGLIDAHALALLPSPSLLVNIGRGAIVDEAALYEALRAGQLHAAGLDVWYNYPEDKAARENTAPASFPFHELDNVVMSPHRGGDTGDTEPLRMQALARLLNAAARGEAVANPVNVEAGY